MKVDETLDPAHVGRLGADAVVFEADLFLTWPSSLALLSVVPLVSWRKWGDITPQGYGV